MAEAITSARRSPWHLNGSPRAVRAVYVVTLLREFTDRSLDQIIDDIGWLPEEAEQVRQDSLSFIKYILEQAEKRAS